MNGNFNKWRIISNTLKNCKPSLKEKFHKIIPFLSEENILDCRPVGNIISGNGNATKFRLSPLDNFSSCKG